MKIESKRKIVILRKALFHIAEGPVSPEEKNYSEDYGRGFWDCLKICQHVSRSALDYVEAYPGEKSGPEH